VKLEDDSPIKPSLAEASMADHAAEELEHVYTNLMHLGKQTDMALEKMAAQAGRVPVRDRQQYQNDADKLHFARFRTGVAYANLFDWAGTEAAKELDLLYEEYVQRLVMLELTNRHWEAVFAVEATVWAAFFVFTNMEMIPRMKKAAEELVERLQGLKEELPRLQAKLEEAEGYAWKTRLRVALDLALNAVTICMGPAGGVALIVRTARFTIAQTGIDYLLSPEGIDLNRSGLTSITSLAGGVPKLFKGERELARVGHTLTEVGHKGAEVLHTRHTLHEDADDVAKADKRHQELKTRVSGLKTRIDSTVILLRRVRVWVKEMEPKIQQLKVTAEKLVRAYKIAIAEIEFTSREYQDLRKTLP
jgi:hypothetical protein